jgi:hypothetical protein
VWPPSSGSCLMQIKRPRGGDRLHLSRITIRLPRPRTGSGLTTRSWVVSVAAVAEPEECDVESEDDDVDSICRGIHEFPRHRENATGVLGGICRTLEFPTWMWTMTAARVRPETLHQQRPVPRCSSLVAEEGPRRTPAPARSAHGRRRPTRRGCRGSAPAAPTPR